MSALRAAWAVRASCGMRVCAGQGLIQFARGTRSGTPYAAKFCVTPDAFQAESDVYGDQAMAHVVPRVAATVANADLRFRDPEGTPMPPCLVIESGRGLDEWAARHKPSVAAAANVRTCSVTPPSSLRLRPTPL